MIALHLVQRERWTIEEVDAVSGPPLGRPRTATFRLADLVGLDTLRSVAHTVHERAPHDESRAVFVPPDFFSRMVERGLLGQKSGAGFYRKAGSEIRVLDLDTLDHRAARRPELPELKALEALDEPGARMRELVDGEHRAAGLAWALLAPTLVYAAWRLGEIADDAATIDRAMELGFNWELGPFRTWDALGFRRTVERLRADGHALPEWVEARYAGGAESLYELREGLPHAPTARPGAMARVEGDARALRPAALRAADRRVRGNAAASLVDLGDGVLALEFHSKMNTIDPQTIEMIEAAVDEAERGWQAIVVANDGMHFSAGANLARLAESAQRGDWPAIERMIVAFQTALGRLERAAVPVVAAPHGLALGGGAEVVLACHAVHAAAESYIGLVEAGAGLLPAGGGCLRLYRRHVQRLPRAEDPYPALTRTFEILGVGKTSTSAEEARELGFLGPDDGWSMNGDWRVDGARALALARARAGRLAPPPAPLPVMGRGGIAVIETMLVNLAEGRFISEHDRKIGREIARVLCGGDLAGPSLVSEQHLLDLERESFLRLCGEPRTHERIEALLRTGKPLRN
jgi:3-hydroxyacyl-CoA dehydrogenase